MPVAAKLSKKFYDRFGEDIVNELWSGLTRWTRHTGLTFAS